MPRVISIDLGSHAVKVSTYRTSGRRVDLEDRYIQKVPQEGETTSLEARLAALDALLDEHNELAAGGSDTVAAVFPGDQATFHRMSMPFSDKAQIEKTLPFAVEAEVPFDLEEMVLGWRTLSNGGRADVMATLARHETLSDWIEGLASRSLDPAVVVVDTELLGYWGADPSGGGGPHPEVPAADDDDDVAVEPVATAVAVLDMGHQRTLVAVVVDGTVHACRAINFGGHAFTRAIQQTLGCSWDEAERLKHGPRVQAPPPSPDEEVTDVGERLTGYAALPAPARAAMDGAIGLLLAEVRSTLIKAEDTLGVTVDALRVTGGSARIPELWDYLAADLGLSVHAVADPEGEPVPLTFSTSHALAMQVVGSHETDVVDLRIGDLEYRGGTDVLRATLVYGTAGLVFFAAAAVLMFVIQYRSLHVEQGETDARTEEILAATFPEIPLDDFPQEGSTKVAMAEALTDDAEQRAEILGEGSGVPPMIDTLAELTATFPPHPEVRVEVSQLTVTPAQINFDAETDGYASSAAVETRLQQHPKFKGATKGNEKKITNNRVRFPITIPLGDAVVEGAPDLAEEG